MKLRIKYILFILFLHLVTLVLAFYVWEKNKLIFIAAEIIVFISLWISWRLYQQLIGPLNNLMMGIEAIRDREFTVKFLYTGKIEMDQLIEVYNNMIDQLRIERTRQEQQHYFLEKLIHTSPTGIIILDHDRIVEQLNPKVLTLLGATEKELKGRPLNELFHPLLAHVSKMEPGDSRTISVNGINTFKIQLSSFVDRGFPRIFILIEEMTAEILAAEKKVYEKVIRMMAHEVNNTIGPVNSIIQSTLKAHDKHPYSQSTADALQVAMNRNNNLNIFMRNFAELVKLPEPAFRKIDLVVLIGKIVRLLSIRAGERQIRFEVEGDEEPFILLADEQQIEQALLNIVKNSIEAIEGEGVVRFRIDKAARKLIISDNGSGVDVQHVEKLFSSFFSTKKDGQGIGLMLVRDILMNHQFTFSLNTVREGCTEFVINF